MPRRDATGDPAAVPERYADTDAEACVISHDLASIAEADGWW